MKQLRVAAPGLVLLLAQIPIGWAVWMAEMIARHHWVESDMELPLAAIWAIRFGMVIPIGALVASVLILILSLKKGRACMSVAFSLAIGEAILLALFGLGLVLPAMDILYHMGDS